MAAQPVVDGSLISAVRDALISNALPGELDGFSQEDRDEAAAFVVDVGAKRKAGELALQMKSIGGEVGKRRMRLAIVNDDMPFLVDSVAGAIAGRELGIHRLLHPVVKAQRDDKGNLIAIGEGQPESIIYIELDRADARRRQELVEELRAVLTNVRHAVADWREMLACMEADAEILDGPDDEGAALLRWLAENHFTLLGHAEIDRTGHARSSLGILRGQDNLWDEPKSKAALEHLSGKEAPALLLKADRLSPVHRRVPLDVVMVRRPDGCVSVHCGLWTSAAMREPAEHVPVLRGRLAALDRELGYSPSSHGGKALAHAISTLPHDLLISFDEHEVRDAALTAMSLADRPRPKLLLLTGALQRQLYAFVWLPREQLTTARRLAISDMVGEAVDAPLSSWSVDVGEDELALARFTYSVDTTTKIPDVEELDARLVEMVRGWAPAVENELVDQAGSGRGARLALTYLNLLPDDYQARTNASEAAQDIVRLGALEGPDDRDVRLISCDTEGDLRLKIYRCGGFVPLSDAVPVLENFGFRVLEEMPTRVGSDNVGHIHDFEIDLPEGVDCEGSLERNQTVERAVASVLRGESENDDFNKLILAADLSPQAVVWLRAWFRYLRQTGVTYGVATVVDALGRAPAATKALIDIFSALHDPQHRNGREQLVQKAREAFEDALRAVSSIEDDRILRLMRALVEATLRTNAFSPASALALAMKINSSKVPGLPAPVPWREIWVYSPRVEGIHLRYGPIARGGLRWSDRRDDFRTEVLGLMKAQVVKNAVIVPTGAKGGFYPKQLPSPANRDAWLTEGTESYKVFIRSLLSITDNILEDKVVHPESVVIHDGDDPYFVVAADKGTATFSDVANGLALEGNFWLGDAFASGGSNGYDHKAMGITAKGAWVSVQRHFLEMGIDVQTDPVRVVGCGDMSGDVFGNGMLLSQAIKLVAAFDHRHIFIDPNPDPAASWAERKRMFELPRSSWDDYDRSVMSKGGMIVPRSQKSITLTEEARTALGIEATETDPTTLISAILKSAVDLVWFGGIGTYIKASTQSHADVGDTGNDVLRVDANQVRARVIGEGANLAITQAARIEFSEHGGRINTDFIDNSAGVDCSDNEVNIKIPLNREMREGRLEEGKRNALLEKMTDEVSELVLEDNRLQSLALSIAEAGGAQALPALVRTIEILEASGRLDRKVEGLASSDVLLRRGMDGRGLTRPELAVILSMSKMSLQEAIEKTHPARDPILEPQLFAAFPKPMQKAHADAIRAHRLRDEILGTKVANRMVNRLGPSICMLLSEEEGVSLGQVATAFLAAEELLDLPKLWHRIEQAEIPESLRIELFQVAARSVRSHVSDILRSTGAETTVSDLVNLLGPGVKKVAAAAARLIRSEVRNEAASRHERLINLGADEDIVDGLVRLYELDGVMGIAALAARKHFDELDLTKAYVVLGEALGLDWAQQQVARFVPADPWERLLIAGLERDFEQLRIDFLGRLRDPDLVASTQRWIDRHASRIEQFRRLVVQARTAGAVTAAMLAQIASQARVLLGR
ncbi:NAD-glutamate dehydrogenase [Sphingomonas alba]|uniref:NAD-glutamate dehydrogenase n=1 Tax=Sphingomonas alba TaxID=2908208 RepID=A0ABT0RLR6_9SPHN|nr:NAD-glutamate dehydrogenase domain-containing protein [Sphingomonas alba]MCL6683576.1 NAD-glutamate dehydrogenase [Sphingomonas alba]